MAKVVNIEELRAQFYATKAALIAGNIEDPAKAKRSMQSLSRRISKAEAAALEALIEA